ncbi:hypothetical protein PCL_13029 [Purpureocillium lilacinum]|uniref:Uncharacterized protein n=1 Tax=Purpureocillium lilacinum TaxID=33203 RepID=A0A2U3E7Y4_PURLI|nr:hypothetical protein PCL_13029 [Purpureocillium lilacinum]
MRAQLRQRGRWERACVGHAQQRSRSARQMRRRQAAGGGGSAAQSRACAASRSLVDGDSGVGPVDTQGTLLVGCGSSNSVGTWVLPARGFGVKGGGREARQSSEWRPGAPEAVPRYYPGGIASGLVTGGGGGVGAAVEG